MSSKPAPFPRRAHQARGLARRPHSRTVAPPAFVTTSLARLEEQMGGREALVAALAHAPRTTDVDYVLGLLGDPGHAKHTLAYLCAMGGITAGELLDAYKAGELNRAQVLSTRIIGQSLPATVADTMLKSAPYEATCYRCRGTASYVPEPTKEVPNPPPGPCDVCQGTGVLVVDGDLEHKKLALELGQMTAKSGGINLQVNQQSTTFVGTVAGSLERTQAATDRILYGDGDGEVLDGELTDSGGDHALAGGERGMRSPPADLSSPPSTQPPDDPDAPREDVYP